MKGSEDVEADVCQYIVLSYLPVDQYMWCRYAINSIIQKIFRSGQMMMMMPEFIADAVHIGINAIPEYNTK